MRFSEFSFALILAASLVHVTYIGRDMDTQENWLYEEAVKERIAMNQNDTNEVALSPSVSKTAGDSMKLTFPPKLSADGRYLVDQQERPFLVIGDSPWSLIVELTPDQVDLYLDDRQAKGFTLLLVNLIEHKFASDPRIP